MTRSVKRWWPIWSTVVGSLALGGVGQAAEVVLRLATWDGPEGQVPIRDTVAEFERAHPGVKVQIEQVDDYKNKLVVQIAGGVGPDVFMVGDWDYAELAQAGLTENLSPYLRRDNVDLKMYIPTLLENHRHVNGAIYSLPKDFSTLGVYYNKDLFAAAGLEDPKPGWTWAQAVDMARKLKRVRSDGTVEIWPIVVNPWWNAIAWSFASAAGYELMAGDYRSVRGKLDQPEAINALRFFYDLQKVQQIVAPDPVRDGLKGEKGMFAAGKAAIMIWGNWAISEWRNDPKLNWGTVVPPVYGQRPTTFLMEAGWGLNPNIKDANRKELAWQLVKMLGTERGQYYMGRTGWAMPSIPSVAREVGILRDPYYAAFFEAAYHSMPTYWTKVPTFGRVFDEPFSQAREQYLTGRQALDVAIREVVDRIEQNLRQVWK